MYLARESFLREALILALAGFLSRIIGAIYRIPLTAVIGEQGMGLYQMAYPLYVTILAVSTSGINIAISKLVSEKITLRDYRGANRTLQAALALLTGLGLTFSLIMLLGAHTIAEWIGDPLAYYSIVALSPAVLFVSVSAAFRGYFQGHQRMTPTAISQIVEQTVRVAVAFPLAYALMPVNLAYAAGGATFGAAAGAVASLTVLLTIYFRSRPRLAHLLERDAGLPQESSSDLVKAILRLSIPVSLAAVILPIMNAVDLMVVPARLGALGYGVETVRALYGRLTGLALPIVTMPTVITYALSLSLVPAISKSHALRSIPRVREQTATGVRMTLLLTLPAVVGLYILGTPIALLLYRDTPETGPLIAVLSPALLFLALQQTTSGTLQGLGRTDLPVRNMAIGALGKLVASYILTGIPSLGIVGAAYSSVIGFLIAASLNIYSVNCLVGFSFDFRSMMLKPAIAVTAMGIAVQGVFLATHRWLSGLGGSTPRDLATAVAIGLGAIIYFTILVFIRAFKEQDFEVIPRIGPRLGAKLRALGLVDKE